MTHTCHAVGCTAPVPPKMFMCRQHWYALPKPLRDAVWAAYRPGQERDKRPSLHYLEVTDEARRWLAEKAGMLCQFEAHAPRIRKLMEMVEEEGGE